VKPNDGNYHLDGGWTDKQTNHKAKLMGREASEQKVHENRLRCLLDGDDDKKKAKNASRTSRTRLDFVFT
jgi:hypothetical protein